MDSKQTSAKRECFVCELQATVRDEPHREVKVFTCPVHKTYELSYHLVETLPKLRWPETRASLARGLRFLAEHGKEASLLDEVSVMRVIGAPELPEGTLDQVFEDRP
jgi:hypothetical protein